LDGIVQETHVTGIVQETYATRSSIFAAKPFIASNKSRVSDGVLEVRQDRAGRESGQS
jgi:hypothetical protein